MYLVFVFLCVVVVNPLLFLFLCLFPLQSIGEITMRLCVAVFSGFLLLAGSAVLGQGSDAALKDRVAQLVERLDAPKAEAQDAAEKALIGLGPRVLPLLPDVTKTTPAARKERLERIVQALREAEETANLDASKVTIKGKGIRLSEAIRQLQAQTGNAITDLREQLGSDVTNPAFDLEIENMPFFQALDQITQKAELELNFFTGDGSIGLMAAATMAEEAKAAQKTNPYVFYTGPFRVTFKQIFASRNLQAGSGSANAQFDVAWEPRLRPMLMALKADDFEIVDDQGNKVAPAVMQESTDVVLRQENPVAELNINMASPERKALKLAKLKIKAEITVPAAFRTFKFPSLASKNVEQKQGDITVKLEDTEIDEQVWKVHVSVTYPEDGPAFESYRQGLFNNKLWLQKADGSRFAWEGGYSNTGSDGGRLGFEYLFVEAPGKPADYQFVYETPSKVLTIPLEFEFKDVPLP
jgi:hypothetical protein